MWIRFLFFFFIGALIISLTGLFVIDEQYQVWLRYLIAIESAILFLFIAFHLWAIRKRHSQNQAEHLVVQAHREDANIIRNRFRQAIRKIQSKDRYGMTNIYDLPWYVVLGEPQSGKSRLLQANAFESVDTHHQEAHSADEYLRFWVNDQAVIIEVGKKLFDGVMFHESRWNILIKTLLKYRARQGLNGVITSIALTRITHQPETRFKLSKAIQEVVLTLEEKLGLTLPLYCVLTKMDQVSDLVPFFSVNIPSHEWDLPFGITLNCDDKKRFDVLEFEQKAQQLLKQLASGQLKHLRNMGCEMAHALVSTPYQFSLILNDVKSFLIEVGRENRIRNAIWVRGAYFCTLEQQGEQQDLLSQVIAQSYEFQNLDSTPMMPAHHQFFSGRLLQTVIVPERNIVGVYRAEQIKYFLWQTLLAVSVIGFILFLGMKIKNNWQSELNWQSQAIEQLAQYETDVLSLDRNFRIIDVIHMLDDFRSIVQESKTKDIYNRVSLQEHDTYRKINAVYQNQLKEVLLKQIAELISSELYVYLTLGKPSKVFEILYYYKMLFDPRLLDKESLIQYLSSNLQSQGEITNTQLSQFEILLEDLFSVPSYASDLEINQELLTVAINNLDGLSHSRLIYNRIRNSSEYRTEIDVRQQLGDRFHVMFEFKDKFQGYIIPEMFTKQGYSNIDLTPKSEMLRHYLRELKDIQGDNQIIAVSEMTELSKEILFLYFTDYIQYWKSLLANIKVKSFDHLRAFETALNSAKEPITSPIQDVLEAVINNTRLAVEEQPDTKKARATASALGLGSAAKVIGKANRINRAVGGNLLKLQPSFVVNEAFMPIANYLEANEAGTGTPLQNLLVKYADVSALFSRASGSSYPDKVFHEYMVSHAKGSQDALVELQILMSKAPEPIADWSKSFLTQAWHMMIQQSSDYIQQQWQSEIITFYRDSIAGRFPFDPKGRGEVRLEDFISFFKPQGRLDVFIEKYTAPFLVWDNQKLELNDIEGQTIEISSLTMQQLERAKRISQIFFGSSGQTMSLTFRLKAKYLSEKVTKFALQVSHPLFDYAHGPRVWKTIKWPFPEMDNILMAYFYRGKNVLANQSYEGDWSFIRFLFDGENKQTETRLMSQLKYRLKDQSIAVFYTVENSQYILNKSLFDNFYLKKDF